MEESLSTPNDAEVKLLAALLLRPESLTQVVDLLHPEDFFQERHRLIYTAVLSLSQQQSPISAQTVCEVLEQQGSLDSVGGSEYLTSLGGPAEEQETMELAASLHKHAAARRRLLSAGEQIQHLARTEPDETIAIKKATQLLAQVNRNPVTFALPLAELLVESKKKLNQRRTQSDEWSGVPTGFDDLDRLTDGLQPSDLIIVAAPPSTGKTSFVLSIAFQAAVDAECRVGIFSLQTNRQRLAQRLLTIAAETDYYCLRTGRLEDRDAEFVIAVAELLTKEAGIWIDDTTDLSTEQLRHRARYLVEHKHVGLIIVDDIDLMRATVNGRRLEPRIQEVEEISRTLKVIARELNVPVLAVAQLSRAMESRPHEKFRFAELHRVTLGLDADLMRSVESRPHEKFRFAEPRLGFLEQNADLMLILHRDELNHREPEYPLVKIIVAKHRNGPVADITIYFETNQMRFRDLPLALQEEQPEEEQPS